MSKKTLLVMVAAGAFACQNAKDTAAPADKTEKAVEAEKKPANAAASQAAKPANNVKAAVPAAGDIPAPDNVAAAPADAKKTASGLQYVVLKSVAEAKSPTADDIAEVHYTGWTTDGKMFDSSKKRGRPAKFPLKRVIPGWTEGVQLMKVGETFRFWIPAKLAYEGRSGPQGTLVFDVELLSFEEGPKPIPAPDNVAAAPKNAKKTKSGLKYIVLTEGKGKSPVATDTVEVHYSGWTTDGKMFDSSVMRKRPATFPLNGVIAGWTEGVQLMKVGSKYRFWIPEELAYKGRKGAPQGMLVFDVELLNIR